MKRLVLTLLLLSDPMTPTLYETEKACLAQCTDSSKTCYRYLNTDKWYCTTRYLGEP